MKNWIVITGLVVILMTCTNRNPHDQAVRPEDGLAKAPALSQEDSSLEVFARIRMNEYPADSNGISIKLALDIVDLQSEMNYPLGLGLHYQIINNTNDKLFINFQPVSVAAFRDDRRSFFLNKSSVVINQIVPSAVRNAVIQLPCESRPSAELSKKLYESLGDDENRNYPGKKLFADSFLFLNPHEVFECTENISGLLHKTDTLDLKGRYRFYIIFDGSKDTVFYQNRVPNQFEGYKRYEGKAISNQIFLNIR